MIYLLNATGLTPGGSSIVHIYTQTKHRKTQWKHHKFGRTNGTSLERESAPAARVSVELL